MKKVATRFPPSPTGYFHIGSARTALFNHLFAASQGGVMFLRFEDTDKARTKKEYEDDILAGMDWLKIPYEKASPMRQSEKTKSYTAALQQLITSNHAYISEEPKKDDPSKTMSVVRLKNPGSSVTFSDLIRGEVTFDTKELGDFVIARGTDDPLYHLTVVVDDHDMNITHVIRGEDHISNTARQILILEALDYERPIYAHIPLILASDRSKLSKRHGAVSINEYRSEGFLPEAMVNYLALLGWNPGGEQELYSMGELEKAFEINRVHKGGAVFDIEKLKWFNYEYLKRMSSEEYKAVLEKFRGDANIVPGILGVLQERCQTLKEASDALDSGEFSYLEGSISYETDLLTKGAKTDSATAASHLEAVLSMLEKLSGEDFSAERVKEAVFPYATEKGRASVLWPLRVALSGREKSPDPFVLAGIMKKEATLERVKDAIKKLR